MKQILTALLISASIASISSCNNTPTDPLEKKKDSIVTKIEDKTDSIRHNIQADADSLKNQVQRKGDSLKAKVEDKLDKLDSVRRTHK